MKSASTEAWSFEIVCTRCAILSGLVTSPVILVSAHDCATDLPNGPSGLNLIEFRNRIIEDVSTTTSDNN